MRSQSDLRRRAIADVQGGWRVSSDDLTIAALVVMPFTATLTIFVSQLSGLPSLWLIILFAIVQVVATLWNAGWRARTSEPHEG